MGLFVTITGDISAGVISKMGAGVGAPNIGAARGPRATAGKRCSSNVGAAIGPGAIAGPICASVNGAARGVGAINCGAARGRGALAGPMCACITGAEEGPTANVGPTCATVEPVLTKFPFRDICRVPTPCIDKNRYKIAFRSKESRHISGDGLTRGHGGRQGVQSNARRIWGCSRS